MLLSPSQTRSLFEHALARHYAVLAVNADSAAAIADVLEVALELDAPVIIETSLWQLTGRSFGIGDPILGMARYLTTLAHLAGSDRFGKAPVAFHTDHIKGPETLGILKAAVQGIPVALPGYEVVLVASSVSLDSSELTHEENISHMRALCDAAKACGRSATLEMEAGVDDGVTPLDDTRKLFGSVEKTHPGFLALWAPGVGTQHGLGSGGGFDAAAVEAHARLATELAGRPIGIALHGSSGLSDEALRDAVAAGVAKVNWSSESLFARSSAARAYYAERGRRLVKGDPRFKETAMDNGLQGYVSEAYKPCVRGRMQTLGSAGQAESFLKSL